METVAGIVVVIIVFVAIWRWLKKEFPLATDVTETLAKGAVELTAWTVRRGIDLHARAQHTVQCTRCRTIITIYGTRRCGHCGFREQRNEFAPCSHCGRTGRGYVNCPPCRTSIRPWWVRRRRN